MQNPFLFEAETLGYESQFEDSSEYFEGEYADTEYEGEVRRGRGGGRSSARSSSARSSRYRPRQRSSKRPPPPRRRQNPSRYPVPYSSPGFNFNYGGAQPIQQGSQSVRLVQSLLNRALGLNLVVDGIMNVETQNAIRNFRSQGSSPADNAFSPPAEPASNDAFGPPAEPAPTEDQPAQTGNDTDNAQEEYGMFEFYNTEADLFELADEGRWTQELLEAEMADETSPNTGAGLAARTLQENAVKLAQQEWARWGKGTIKESDTNIRPVLQDYWKTGTGQARTEPNWWSKVPWSAAFISWIMKKAGAGKDFRYSAAHANYIKAAKDNRRANNANPFKAYRINEISPQPGDLVCACRESCQANYDNISSGMPTHCDIVTERHPGYIVTIGGNVNQTVGRKTVPLDANGFIKAPKYFTVIRSSLLRPSPPVTTPASTPSNISTGSPDIISVRGIKVARQIAPQIEALLAAATAAGVRLSGGGYRSKEQQIRLRIAHCGGNTPYNIYEKPSKQCTPPTAPPGRSMHEKGLAIDFTYNGKGIKSRSNPGFIWLANNAARFGLRNLPSEPWHWSVNGK